MNEIIGIVIIFITAIGAAAAITTQAFKRSTSIGTMPIEQSAQVEELPVAQPVLSPKVEAVSKGGLSDEDFRTLFLNADKSVEDIAEACGYKSSSSVYRRAKRLGLAVTARKR